MPIPSSSARNAPRASRMRRFRARYSAVECRPPRRNKSGTAEVNAPLSLNTETKALFYGRPFQAI